MSNITNSQYWVEVQALAESIVSEAANQVDCTTQDTFDRDQIEELINDSLLHETIDGHKWVIYYAYNLDVLQHTDNAEYAVDNFGTEYVGEQLKKSLSDLHVCLAFWALYADVQDHISGAIDEYESSLESEEQAE